MIMNCTFLQHNVTRKGQLWRTCKIAYPKIHVAQLPINIYNIEIKFKSFFLSVIIMRIWSMENFKPWIGLD